MSGFECERPFDIDNGELDGISLPVCFVLGYELAQVDSLIRSGESFERPIHAQNMQRIVRELERQTREFEVQYMHEDRSENWVYLSVGGAQ